MLGLMGRWLAAASTETVVDGFCAKAAVRVRRARVGRDRSMSDSLSILRRGACKVGPEVGREMPLCLAVGYHQDRYDSSIPFDFDIGSPLLRADGGQPCVSRYPGCRR